MKTLKCGMVEGCTGKVSRIDNKGHIYCEPCGMTAVPEPTDADRTRDPVEDYIFTGPDALAVLRMWIRRAVAAEKRAAASLETLKDIARREQQS